MGTWVAQRFGRTVVAVRGIAETTGWGEVTATFSVHRESFATHSIVRHIALLEELNDGEEVFCS